jgi:hypothetical protein
LIKVGWRRDRNALLALYPFLALLSFPTLGLLLQGTASPIYALDVFDDGGGLARLAIAVRDWTAHGPTLWDSFLTAGNAFLGQFALSPYAPDVALAFVVGPFAAFTIFVWAISAIAGIGMHLFARDALGLSTAAAVGGAVIAVLGWWHPIYGISVAILPIVLWLTDRWAKGGMSEAQSVGCGALIGALSLYAGQVQIVVFVAAIQLAWLLYVARGPRRHGSMIWAGSWALAFAIYGPVLATQIVMLPISERTVWDLAYLYGTGLTDALATIVEHYRSVLLGIPVAAGIGPDDWRYGELFLGAIGLPLAIVGAVAGRRDSAARFVLILLVAIPLLDLTALLITPLLEHLGALKSFQFVRIRHFFPFALAAAAALGIDAIASGRLAQESDPWRRRVAIGGAIVVLALVSIEALIGGRTLLRRLGGLDAARPADVGWLLAWVGLILGLIGGVALAVIIVRRTSRITAPVLVAIGLLFVGERVLLGNGAMLVGPHLATFDSALAQTPGQAFLLAQPGIDGQRVLTFGDDPNRMAFQGLRQVDGYQAIYPLAYHGFFGALTAPQLATDPDRYRYFHSWGARAYAFGPAVDPELVALSGARWLYVRGDGVPTIPGLIARFASGDVTVYEDPAAFSRAFLVGAVDQGPEATILDRLAAASLDDLHGRAYASGADARLLDPTVGSGLGAASVPGPAGTATVVVDDPDRIEIDIRADRSAVLVLTDVMAPGWVAEADGRPVPIATVDAAFRGVLVAPGLHRIVFRYAPAFTYLGFGLAISGFVSLGAAVWILGKRARSAPQDRQTDARRLPVSNRPSGADR